MRPVKTVKGLGCDESSAALVGALVVALLRLVSIEVVRETLEEEVADARRFLASSRGTFGPPARLHATPCRTQLEQGASSLHCQNSHQRVRTGGSRAQDAGGTPVRRTFTCRRLHWAQPLRLFLCPTRGALLAKPSILVKAH